MSHLDVFIIVPFSNYTRLAVVTEAVLRFGDFLSEKSCRHKLVVSTSVWSRSATECFFSFEKQKNTAALFWFVNALWVCWQFMGVLVFEFGLYVSEVCLFLCLFLMRSFVVQIFFIFQDTVWLVKSSWCVHYCSIHQFSRVSDRCRSGFALW